MRKLSFFSSISFQVPASIVIFCAILAFSIGYIGYGEFENLSDVEYIKSSNQFAYIARSFLNPEKLTDYAKSGQADEEWHTTLEKLRYLTDVGNLASIFVTIPDTENYESRAYIFHTINNSLLSNTIPHKLGDVESLADKTLEYRNNIALTMELGISHSESVSDRILGGYVIVSIPVENAKEESIAVLTVIKPMNEMQFLHQRYLRATIIASLVITLIIVILYSFMTIFKIVRPLRFITFETSHFADHGGTLSGVLKNVHNKDEFGLLSQSIKKMSSDMSQYIDKITHMAAETERINTELNVATEIQENMLPSEYPAFPERTDFDLFAKMSPAKEVGGDLYTYMLLDDDHLLLSVGDVSGKGVPAALFMVITKTLLASHSVQCLSPAEIFQATNNQLCENNNSSMFVTCWLGILTLSTGELSFVNAAHPHAIIYTDNEFKYLETKPNLMLGGMENTRYEEHKITLRHGDRLLIYTDGVTEATNENKELFAEERLLHATMKTLALNAKDTVKSIREDIDKFIGKADQFDDITMLAFLYK